MINCKSINNNVGYFVDTNSYMKLVDCGALNNTTLKIGSNFEVEATTLNFTGESVATLKNAINQLDIEYDSNTNRLFITVEGVRKGEGVDISGLIN